ncbi:GAF domain-containing protein [Bradyrhizobium diazoefficiens]|nr:GAF domain-containing sensor histidine kinase [Bradyrhizobium diazoefficiens]QQO21106.1 GAF domain-containing protein [Bradyrhizobium diazoefficiens]
MTALPHDVVAELKTRIAELEQQLQASSAENAQLEHAVALSRDRQQASAEILRMIARTPVDAMQSLRQIAETCGRLFGAPSVSIRLAENGEWTRDIGYGETSKRVRSAVPTATIRIGGPNLPGTVVAENRQIHISDLDRIDPAMADWPGLPHARAAGTRTICGTPLRREDKAIGVLIVYRDKLLPFTPDELILQQSFADQAVIAIENARLFDEVQAKTRNLEQSLQQQTATADVLKVISRSAFDLQAVLETLIKSAVELSGANRGSIFLREGDVFPLKAASSTTPEFLQYWAANPPRAGRGSATSRVIASGKVEIIPDVLDDPEMQMPAGSLVRIRAALGVPMLRDNKVEGVLVLTRPEAGPFTKSQIDLVQTFADQAVIAVENVRLFDEVQAKTKDLAESLQQQTATADVLKVISRSAFDLRSVLETLVASAGELCGADGGVIWLRKGDLFHAGAAAGFSPQEMTFFRDNPRSIHDKSLAPRVLRSRRTEHIPDRSLDPEFAFPGMSGLPSTMLGVPLLRDDHVEGVFTLARKNVAPFTPRQIELVESFADQAVIAIGNVRLFEEVQQRTRELSKSLDDLHAAQDRLVQTEKLASLGQLTAGIAHEIKNPLNFVNNFAALSGELVDELNALLKTTEVAATIRDEVDELTGMLKDNLQKVVQHGKRADSIVKNMLLHSREGSGEHRPTDVNALVEESLNLAYHGARAEKPQFDITLKREFDPAAGMLEAFPQEITRVLLNLIANGFYATAKHKAGNGDEEYEPVLVARTRDAGAHVEICIRDNGTGIPPEVRDKMFNPFFTTKPAGEGTGLGLSMSHDIIVKQHGGTIEVETVPGEFTEFTIRLPRKGSSSEQTQR